MVGSIAQLLRRKGTKAAIVDGLRLRPICSPRPMSSTRRHAPVMKGNGAERAARVASEWAGTTPARAEARTLSTGTSVSMRTARCRSGACATIWKAVASATSTARRARSSGLEAVENGALGAASGWSMIFLE